MLNNYNLEKIYEYNSQQQIIFQIQSLCRKVLLSTYLLSNI